MGPSGPAALRPTHHLPPEDPDPLVSLHTRLSTQVEGPLREHQATERLASVSIGVRSEYDNDSLEENQDPGDGFQCGPEGLRHLATTGGTGLLHWSSLHFGAAVIKLTHRGR